MTNILLIDEQMTGLRNYCNRLLELSSLASLAKDMGISFVNFADEGLPESLSDDAVWDYCYRKGYILFTDNRNAEGEDSLEAVIQKRCDFAIFPVITIGNRERFKVEIAYAISALDKLIELIFDGDHHLGTGRIYIP